MNKKSKSSAVHFIDVKPESTAISTQNAGLLLLLPNGIRIGIGGEINGGFMQTVLAIAGGIKCSS